MRKYAQNRNWWAHNTTENISLLQFIEATKIVYKPFYQNMPKRKENILTISNTYSNVWRRERVNSFLRKWKYKYCSMCEFEWLLRFPLIYYYLAFFLFHTQTDIQARTIMIYGLLSPRQEAHITIAEGTKRKKKKKNSITSC